jgi:hypothetical protein
MSGDVKFDVPGLDELDRALKSMEVVTQKKVLRKAVREGAKPVLIDAQRGVRQKWGDNSGALHDSIKLRTSAPRNPTWADMIASIGVFRIKAIESIANEAYYNGRYVTAPVLAYWFEYGVQPHSLGKKSRASSGRSTGGGHHPGINAAPVLRPSMDNNVDIVTRRTANVLKYELDKLAR